jgi:hypothetical protein
VTKDLALEQLFRHGSAIDGLQTALFTPEAMDGLGHQLFTGTRLAHDQHGQVAESGHRGDLLAHQPYCGGVAENLGDQLGGLEGPTALGGLIRALVRSCRVLVARVNPRVESGPRPICQSSSRTPANRPSRLFAGQYRAGCYVFSCYRRQLHAPSEHRTAPPSGSR